MIKINYMANPPIFSLSMYWCLRNYVTINQVIFNVLKKICIRHISVGSNLFFIFYDSYKIEKRFSPYKVDDFWKRFQFNCFDKHMQYPASNKSIVVKINIMNFQQIGNQFIISWNYFPANPKLNYLQIHFEICGGSQLIVLL